MTNDDRFFGRVALVTGAASGIGAATAARLLAEGARVATFDLHASELDGVLALTGDVSASADVEAAVAHGDRGARPDRRPRLLCRRLRRLAADAGRRRRRVEASDGDQRRRRLLVQPRRRARDGRARLRPDRQRRLDRRQGGQPDGGRLLGLEGRRDRAHEGGRQGLRRHRRLRQLHRAGRDRDRHARGHVAEHVDYMVERIPMGGWARPTRSRR